MRLRNFFTQFSSICLSLVIFPAFQARGALVDAFWDGGAGNWNTAALWTPAVVPNNGTGGNTYRVFIDGGNAVNSVVNLNLSATIDTLTMSAGDSLIIDNSRTLSFTSGATIDNAGTIRLNSTGGNAYFRPTNGPITLTGGGVLEMSDNAGNWIYKTTTGGSLINVDNTIQGAGNIGWAGSPTAIENHGTVLANLPNMLLADASAGFTNTAVMRAASGGTLRLGGGVFNNVGGLIEALDASVVQLNINATIAGGTLSTTDTGLISVLGSNSVLDGSTNTVTTNGHIVINNSTHLALRGTVVNAGTIDVNSTGGNAYLQPDDTVTLTGGGVVQMSDSTMNWIYKAGANGSLVNVDNTIQGAGNIGWAGSPTAIENHGTVLANLPNMLLADASAGFTNTAVMRAASGGTLRLGGGVFTNVGGLIEALDASVVQLNFNATIAGGTLSTTDTGLISVLGSSSVLDGSTNTVTTNGHIVINNSTRLTLRGTVVNVGTIDVNSTGGNSYFQPDGAVTLTGGGIVQMSDSTTNWIYKAGANGSLVNVDNTIQGAGNVGWAGSPTAIENQGTIIASGTQLLKLDAATSFTNSGTLHVTGAGGMQITSAGGSFTTSGTVTVDASRLLSRLGTFVQTAGTTTVNGTLTATGTGVLIQGGTLTGNGVVSGALVTNSGTIAPGDAIGNLNLNNGLSLTATSTIEIEIGGLTPVTQHDRLAVLGSIHLDGSLGVSFVNGFDPQVGDSFDVITYPTTSLANLGFFRSFDVPCDLPGRALQVDVSTTFVRVRVVAAGDAYYDVNCDCVFSYASDASAFVTALLFPGTFATDFPGCDILNADFNNDNLVDGQDVQGFVDALMN